MTNSPAPIVKNDLRKDKVSFKNLNEHKLTIVGIVLMVLAVIGIALVSVFLTNQPAEKPAPAKVELSILQKEVPELKNGASCDLFSQPIAYVADASYCETLLVAAQTLEVEGLDNTKAEVEPTICSIRTTVVGVVREAYLCDVLLTAVSGAPVRNGTPVALKPEDATDAETTVGEITLETRPITGGGVACLYINPDGSEYTNYEVSDAEDCASAETIQGY